MNFLARKVSLQRSSSTRPSNAPKVRSSFSQPCFSIGSGFPVNSMQRRFAANMTVAEKTNDYQQKLRNIGISAHIDSGKTTLTERILFYTGRIDEMHEVKGKDNVGATMDFMELEREKGITIQSAATYCSWGDNRINIIDTPGHVDFTIEVERALRVLDGAVLVLCAVAGVQSQTITVDRQMRRYQVPRVVFINKLDRPGSDPDRVVSQLKSKLGLNAHALQYALGLESNHRGVVDLLTNEAVFFDGENGETILRKPIPDEAKVEAESRRQKLIESLADVDEVIFEKCVEGSEVTPADLMAAVRRATISHKMVPVLMGTALKNKGIQLLLDGVVNFLPNPMEVENKAKDLTDNEKEITLKSDVNEPLVGLVFKLEESRFGQLSYMRIYQGTLARGDTITNMASNKKLKVPRLVRMHANRMEEIQSIGAGEICAMFGVDCASGTTFTGGNLQISCTSMFVPEPVVSLSLNTKKRDTGAAFSKALARFQKEDPTFRVHLDPESNETIISGMGELHLEIYVERMKREYAVETVTGKPQVAYRETISDKSTFEYTHKKQSGGAGQFARVCGFLEPLLADAGATIIVTKNTGSLNEFENATVGASIPPQFIPACVKGFDDSVLKGPLLGCPVIGVKMVVNDGLAHSVDSNEQAFRTATAYAFREAFKGGSPSILEPIMKVEITGPVEYQSNLIGALNKRKGSIESTESSNEYITIIADVPLNNMFGYSTELRSATQGKGEFSMEYKCHAPVTRDVQQVLIEQFRKKQQQQEKDK